MTGHLAPRPGFVLDVDRNSPPIVFHHGEGFRSRNCLPAAPGSSTPPNRWRVCPTQTAPFGRLSSTRSESPTRYPPYFDQT